MMNACVSVNLKKTGEHLKNLMIENGYSVKDIQEYLCFSCPQPIYKWFKGQRMPTVENFYLLSQLFHVHMEDLLIIESHIESCCCHCEDIEFLTLSS